MLDLRRQCYTFCCRLASAQDFTISPQSEEIESQGLALCNDRLGKVDVHSARIKSSSKMDAFKRTDFLCCLRHVSWAYRGRLELKDRLFSPPLVIHADADARVHFPATVEPKVSSVLWRARCNRHMLLSLTIHHLDTIRLRNVRIHCLGRFEQEAKSQAVSKHRSVIAIALCDERKRKSEGKFSAESRLLKARVTVERQC